MRGRIMKQKSYGFNRCCENNNRIVYTIKHSPKPIKLVPQLRECIENLLWYAPGINSVQSYDNYLIDNPIYSDIIFDIILDSMGMNKISDVKVVYGKISKEDEDFYKDELCINCKKMIFNRIKNYNRTGKEETITRALLRHLRNSIAHGNFKIINDLVYFKDSKDDNTNAIIKIDIISLNKTLKLIEDCNYITKENVIEKIFKKIGFKVETDLWKIPQYNYVDMIIEKNGKRYCVEIKNYKNNSKLIGYQDKKIDKLINNLSHYKRSELIPLLICDTLRLSDKAKKRLRDEEIILLDKKDISNLDKIKNIFN